MPRPEDADVTVGDIGEAALLERILPLLPDSSGIVVGPGDDSAVVHIAGAHVVTTCDMMIEGPDFRLDWSRPHDVGWKAMASNLADIAAMGALPRGVVVAVATPTDTPVAVVEELARGIADGLGAMAPGCGVIGGDLSVAPVLTISVTVLGDLDGREPVVRSGARVGDTVTVTGAPGRSERGLRALLQATEACGGVLEPARRDALRKDNPDVEHHLAPLAPISAGVLAAKAGATAMMDVSDGLILDASRIARASGVGIDFRGDAVDSEEAAMGGEDHGLLATFPPEASIPEGFHPIGIVVSATGREELVTVDGASPPGSRPGWDPYRDSPTVTTRVSP